MTESDLNQFPEEEFTDQDYKIYSERTQQNSQQLISTLVEFYQKLRNPSSAKVAEIERSFVQCQKKVIRVVEFRKDLEKSVQLEEFNNNHMEEIGKVHANYCKYEETINGLISTIHEKEKYILHLEQEANKVKLKQASVKKIESIESREMSRIQENLREIKSTFANLSQELQKQVSINPPYNDDSTQQDSDALRPKQIFVESKVKFIRMRQEMMQCSATQEKRYIQSLKDAVKVYEEVLKTKIEDPKLNKKAEKLKDEIAVKQEEYNRLCRAQLTLYESQLTKMLKICDSNSVELERVTSEVHEKDILITKLSQKLSERSQAEEQELVLQKEKLQQFNQLRDKLTAEITQKNMRLEGYMHQVKKLEDQKKGVELELRLKNEQLTRLSKLNADKEGELMSLKCELEQLKQSNSNYRLQLQQMSKSMQKDEAKHAKDGSKLKKQVKTLKQSLQFYKQQKEEKDQQLTQFRQLLKTKQLQLESLSSKINAYQIQLLKLQQKNDIWKSQASQSKAQVVEKAKQIKDLSQELEYLGQSYLEIKQKYQEALLRPINEENVDEIKQVLKEQIEKQWQENNEEFEAIISGIYQLMRSENKQQIMNGGIKLGNI